MPRKRFDCQVIDPADWDFEESSEEFQEELTRRIQETAATPVPTFDKRRTKGRWFVAYEWYGGFSMGTESSLSHARRLLNAARDHGSKWTHLGRNKKGAMARLFTKRIWGER